MVDGALGGGRARTSGAPLDLAALGARGPGPAGHLPLAAGVPGVRRRLGLAALRHLAARLPPDVVLRVAERWHTPVGGKAHNVGVGAAQSQ